MRVLGIDPGYGRMGIAVLENVKGQMLKGKCEILYSNCLETSSKDSFVDRLGELAGEIKKLVETWKPERIAIEKLYFETNQKTAMQVAEVRGMVIALSHELGIPVREYTPLQVKAGVTGYGKATKAQVAGMLHKLVKFDIKKGTKIRDDEYDAIAIALTDLATR